VNRYDPNPSPLTADECRQLEALISRAVAVTDAANPNNLPGWVYAGASADFDITLLVVAFRSDTPLALTLIQSLLSRTCELAERFFGARTTTTDPPHGHTH
jgi:predicted RNA-binding protein